MKVYKITLLVSALTLAVPAAGWAQSNPTMKQTTGSGQTNPNTASGMRTRERAHITNPRVKAHKGDTPAHGAMRP